MPYYRRHLTFDEVAPHIQKLRLWLRQNCPVIKEYEGDYCEEAFFFDEAQMHNMIAEFNKELYICQNAGFAEFLPFTSDGKVGVALIKQSADGPMVTVTPTHIRLPKLSHLICLTPEDFFGLLRICNTAKNTQTGNSLMLNPAAAGYTSVETSPLYPFFTKMRVNYRMNPDYADKKWTSREDIKFLAAQDPSRDMHLSAMQYLTAAQNADLLYFPMESVVQLELDWQQATDEYCVPNS